MKRKLILCIALLLTLTLSGWSQPSINSQKWIVYKDNIKGDTVILYHFNKSQLANLRVYVTSLEQYKNLYNVDEKIISAQQAVINNYKKVSNNKDGIIENKDGVINQTNVINTRLSKDVVKFRKRSERWPYFIGAGFIGGVVVCLLSK